MTHKGRPTRTIQAVIRALSIAGSVCSVALTIAVTEVPVARADSPAVTDFGIDQSRAVWVSSTPATRALFLTLYEDGRRDLQIRDVDGDAVVSFVGEHPAWHLDDELSWFVQMPVYVRVLQGNVMADDVYNM